MLEQVFDLIHDPKLFTMLLTLQKKQLIMLRKMYSISPTGTLEHMMHTADPKELHILQSLTGVWT